MARKIRYSVVPDGEVVGTRKSHRTYTHALVDLDPSEPARVESYAGRRDLAEKLLRTYQARAAKRGDTCSLVLVPVTVEAL